MTTRHGSLFSGIGGFDLAAQWMGWENVFHCEWNEFGQKVLHHHFPDSISYNDITQTDFTIHRGTIDILTGGFPCQPYSAAGKRLGKEDDRHLWPEMLRAIREIQPTWVVGENVLGLVNWNGGLVFDEVQADLEAQGYEVQPYVLPACAVNAPHRRDRVWFVAYNSSKRLERGARSCIQGRGIRFTECSNGYAPNSNSNGIQGRSINGKASKRTRQRREGFTEIGNHELIGGWRNFPQTEPTIRGGNDGLLTKPHGTTISKDRNDMDRSLVIKSCLDEGRLKVDFNTGKIYSLKQRGKEGQEIELQGSDCNGYIVHGIRYNGFKTQLKAHQIIWIAANGLYDKKALMIDHKNRDRKDNRLENLRLVDAKGNRENATPYTGRLTDEQKDMLVWLHKEDGIPFRELAEDYGISKSRAHQIVQEHSGIYGITFSKWRNESIKAYGNAVVPQVVYQIFKAIEQYNNLHP